MDATAECFQFLDWPFIFLLILLLCGFKP